MNSPEKTAAYFRDVTDSTTSGDWAWTRETEIVHIRYKGDWTGYDAPWRRVLRAFRHAFGPRRRWEKDLFPHLKLQHWFWGVVAAFRVYLATETHRPDGDLNGGKVICHWEEDGEYLQLIQPSVGRLLADFLMAEPENEHAQKIIAEMQRIEADYSKRISENEESK